MGSSRARTSPARTSLSFAHVDRAHDSGVQRLHEDRRRLRDDDSSRGHDLIDRESSPVRRSDATTMLAIIQTMPRAERGTGALTIAVDGHWNSRMAGKCRIVFLLAIGVKLGTRLQSTDGVAHGSWSSLRARKQPAGDDQLPGA